MANIHRIQTEFQEIVRQYQRARFALSLLNIIIVYVNESLLMLVAYALKPNSEHCLRFRKRCSAIRCVEYDISMLSVMSTFSIALELVSVSRTF